MRGEQYALKVPAVMDQLPSVTQFILSYARHTGKLNDKQVHQLDLVTDEIFSNIVQHGFQSNGSEHVVEVICELLPDRFQVHFLDDAPAFDPLAVTASQMSSDDELQVGGWGLQFLLALMDVSEYQHDGQRNRLIVGKKYL